MYSLSGKWLPLALCFLLALAACDSDEETAPTTVFEDADVDADGTVDTDEFGSFLNQVRFFSILAEYDEDSSGDLSEEEFTGFALFLFDPDDDGIDEGDFGGASSLFFNAEDEPAFGDYDTDESGIVENEEFRTAFGETSFFGDFDTNDNNATGANELVQGFFDLIDQNGNEVLDEDEFNDGVGILFNTELPRQQ